MSPFPHWEDDMGSNWVPLAFLLLTVFVISRGLRKVPQGFQYTVERFG